jgi:NAD(P)-dependent dehydrogenase (short-subunit alcohol dehydrogenase family)
MSGSYVKSKKCPAAMRSAGEHSRTDPGSGRRPALRKEQRSWTCTDSERIGEPGDIAQAYLYCLTQPFATGSILTVDGGTVLA